MNGAAWFHDPLVNAAQCYLATELILAINNGETTQHMTPKLLLYLATYILLLTNTCVLSGVIITCRHA